jgi:hypothetical protein
MISRCEVDRARLDISGGRTTMDQITENLLANLSSEYELTHLNESKQFENFVAHLIVGREQSETFDPKEIVVGDGKDTKGGGDTGIDAIAIIINHDLIVDLDEFQELDSEAKSLDVQFIFIQAETSSGFDGAKILTFGQGVTDFFRQVPQLKQNDKVEAFSEIKRAILKKVTKFKYGNPTCKLFYVTTGKVIEDQILEARMAIVKTDLEALGLFREIDFTRIGGEGISRMYQRSKNAPFLRDLSLLKKSR